MEKCLPANPFSVLLDGAREDDLEFHVSILGVFPHRRPHAATICGVDGRCVCRFNLIVLVGFHDDLMDFGWW